MADEPRKDGKVELTDAELAGGLEFDPELLRIGGEVIARQKLESFRQTWRHHWRAAVWSLIISTALWMEGYDTSVVNSFFAQPQFQKKFGYLQDGEYYISAAIQADLGQITTCGQLVGLLVTGTFQEWMGSRRTFLGGMVLMIGTIFLAVFAQSMSMLMAAEFMMGIPWGMFQTLTTAYAAEICPINMRGYLAAYASVGWGGGKFLATGVIRGTLDIDSDWAWRLPYALQWVWPVPLILVCYFAPESPWWLVRKGRYEEAKAVILRTASPGYYQSAEIDGYCEYMRHTDALDRAEHAKGSFVDLVRGTNLRRTEIQLGVWAIQVWCGVDIAALTAIFLEQGGMSVDFAYDFNVILNSLSLVGVAISWWLLRWVGRRPIYLHGVFWTIVCNLIIGILGFVKQSTAVLQTVGALMTIVNFIFHCSLGPVCYTIVGEMPASRLRAQSIVIGRFFYVANSIVANELNPYMINTTAWDWRAKSGFFWVGAGLICLLWAFLRLPETAGLSFAELDILFANKVSARKFKTTEITDAFIENHARVAAELNVDQGRQIEQKPETERVEVAAAA